MIERSDSDLVARARIGDREAFGHLIERHQPMVKRITLKMARHEYFAQELMQEAFLQAYLSLDRLRDDARFPSWLYGIALNVCRSHLRQQKMVLLSLESLMGGMRVDRALFAAQVPDPEMVVEQRELHRLVLEAVNTLSPKNRDATLLFYYEQLTVQEIAAILRISTSAVKGRLHRARQQLKLRLPSLLTEADPALQERARQTRIVQARERSKEMVKVTVADVVKQTVDENTMYVTVLLDEAGKRLLPIWLDAVAGWSVALGMLEHSLPRPPTFAVMANLLEASGARLEAISISALKGDTYYATLTLRVGDAVREVDARPSDAISLALQMDRPIYVAEGVMEKTGINVSDQDAQPQGLGLGEIKQDLADYLQRMEEQRHSLAELSEEERQARAVEWTEKLISSVFGTED